MLVAILTLFDPAHAACSWGQSTTVESVGPDLSIGASHYSTATATEREQLRIALRHCGAPDAIVQLDAISSAKFDTGFGIGLSALSVILLAVGAYQTNSLGDYNAGNTLSAIGGLGLTTGLTFTIVGPISIGASRRRIVDAIQHRDVDPRDVRTSEGVE